MQKKKTLYILCLVIAAACALAVWHFQSVPNPAKLASETNEQNNKEKRVDQEQERLKTANAQMEAKKKIDKIQDPNEKVEQLVKAMTLEQKVGQLLMVGFKNPVPNKKIADLIEHKYIGGVIYYDRNMKSAKQTAELSNSLQQSALKSNPFSIPLMIGVDQEGGDILRMRNQVSPIPSQQELGKYASPQEVYSIAKLNGEELASMGISINFAPVLDLSAKDSRSLGSQPEDVYEKGTMVLKGLNDSHITGVLKHFPGNGRSSIDPHIDTSSVKANQLDLENSDIYPFKRIIQETDPQNFFVMVTHLKYPAYDAKKPASLSSIIIQKLLRNKLGYKGIVVTDDLEMGAVNKYYSYKDLGKDALNAGADLLLVCHEYEHQLEVYNGIIEAVHKGEVKPSRIDEAVKRILLFKLSTIGQPIVDANKADQIVGSQQHALIIQQYKQNHGLSEEKTKQQ
ncbi:glycoside hydrolase family 3 N-terminal domain-containing protein [Bacillus smithii]|uniref:glycoside hydrolase family 3 N-terminal domain-containing protein n=1 Tax=Bacillus smithii TaxID=1479 RepID=UPI003D24402D